LVGFALETVHSTTPAADFAAWQHTGLCAEVPTSPEKKNFLLWGGGHFDVPAFYIGLSTDSTTPAAAVAAVWQQFTTDAAHHHHVTN
jgi:hypothetical protein